MFSAVRRQWDRLVNSIHVAWGLIRTLARPFAGYDAKWKSITLFGVMVVLLLSITGLNVGNSYVNKDMMTAVEKQHTDVFRNMAILYVAMFCIITFVQVMEQFCEQRLALMLREGLTRHLIGRYLANRTYYRLTSREDIDNPDQRIADDIRTLTQTAVSFAVVILQSILTLIGFASVLWNILPLLFGAAVVYSIVGTLVTVLIGKRLVPLNFLQLKKEADFRFGLIRLRENGEAIALQGAEPGEGRRLGMRLRVLLDNFKQIIAVNRNLQFFTVGYNYMTQVIPILIVAPLYFAGTAEFGVISQSIGAFAFVLGAFSVIVTQFQQISSFAAVAQRIGALIQAVEDVPVTPAITIDESEPKIAFENLTLVTPTDGRELIKGLTYTLPANQRLLISGQNGAGKSALFQAIDGMWPVGGGKIMRPKPEDVIFMPQKPYIAPGPLREQLLESASGKPKSDTQINAVLRELRLEKVIARVGGLDADREWTTVLSPGEKSLLSFARLLLAEPKFAFLDVGVSGLADFWVHTLYRALSRTRTVYVSIGENESLRIYHDVELILAGHGDWAINECRPTSVAG